ncbi:MAG: SurA N-terminal domain-containing protein, partial [Pseudomonadota bacterium]
MLTTFRKSVKNFLGVGIILILCLAFAVWGAGSLTPSGAGTIAKVGSVEIPTQEFERQFRNEVSRIAVQMGGAFTEADARANGFHLGVLNQMIERAALDAQSDAIGLTTSDAELAAAIRDIPAFQNPVTAQFDREVYGRFLANQGLSVARFERDLRGDLVRGQLLDALMSAPAGAGPLAEAIYLRQAETRQIEYLLIQPELAGEPAEPTEEDLRAFHSANAARYTAPEYRSMTVAAFTPDLAIDEVELSEEDLQQAYNFRIDEFVTPERRTVRVLRYDDRDAADTALQRLGAGAAFATLAEEQGSNLDGVTRTLAIASDFLDPAVGEAAFSAEVGLADEPVEGAFAFSVIEVVEIAAAETTPFDDVRDDLRKDLAREAGLGIVFDLAGRFDELRQDGMTLREAATELEIDVIELNAVDATGLGPGGAPIEAVTLPR